MNPAESRTIAKIMAATPPCTVPNRSSKISMWTGRLPCIAKSWWFGYTPELAAAAGSFVESLFAEWEEASLRARE
jgi:hypothetical protein